MNKNPNDRPRRPWRKLVLSAAISLVVLIAATIALLPKLLGSASGRRWILSNANKVLAPGSLQFQEITLSWTEPTELKGVVLTAPNGDRVIDAPRVSWDRSLWRILRERPRFGTLVLYEARVEVKREEDGSVDLIEALKPILAPNPAFDLTIRVDGGSLKFQTPGVNFPLEADLADIVLRFPLGLKPLEFELLLADSKHLDRGALTLVGWFERGVSQADFHVEISNRDQVHDEPTAWMPIEGERVRCLISARATIDRRKGVLEAKGQANAKNLDLQIAGGKGERLRLDSIDAGWNIGRDGVGWKIASVEVKVGEPRGKVAAKNVNSENSWNQLVSGTILQLSGRIDDPNASQERHVDLSGSVVPTFKQSRVNSDVVFELGDGRFKAAGAIKAGPLSMKNLELLKLEAAIALKRAECFGLKLGETEIVARNDGEGGHLRIAPIETTLNGGRFRLDPSIEQDAAGSFVLKLGKGTSLDDAEVNDEVSHRVLSYVAPVLEQATRARGKVSLAIDRAEIPLSKGSERKMEVEGRLVFRDLEFAAGPLVAQLYEAAGKDSSAAVLKLDEPVVLTIADGRVNQKGLAIPIGKSKIEIAGSVGFDKTLDLLASVPIVPQQFEEKGLLGALAAGTRVNVPIRGTLSQPRIDREAFKLGMREMGQGLIDRGAVLGLNELISRISRPRDPNAPASPAPGLSAEERRERRLERKEDRLRRKEMRRQGIVPE